MKLNKIILIGIILLLVIGLIAVAEDEDDDGDKKYKIKKVKDKGKNATLIYDIQGEMNTNEILTAYEDFNS